MTSTATASRAWAGRVIDQELRRIRMDHREGMVLDSQDVIVRMVEKGLGVAVVPLTDQRQAALSLTCVPFGEPQLTRRVVLLERQGRNGGQLSAALARAIIEASRC